MITPQSSFGLLAPQSLLPTLLKGLEEAGHVPSFAIDPSVETKQPLPAAPVFLVILSGEIEKSLEPLEDRLYAEGQETLFDEAEDREEWDSSRWASHLAPKLSRLLGAGKTQGSQTGHAPAYEGADTESSALLSSDGLTVEVNERVSQPQDSSLLDTPLDSAEDFLAEEGSPLFQLESPEAEEDTATTLAETSTPEGSANAEDKPADGVDSSPSHAIPEEPVKPLSPPTSWSLEDPSESDEENTNAPSPKVAAARESRRFDTGGLSFADENEDGEEVESATESENSTEPQAPVSLDSAEEHFPSATSDGSIALDTPHGAANNSGFALIVGGTGGPAPIKEILGHLDDQLPVPVVIRQQLPQGRYEALATNLGKRAPLPVLWAKKGTKLKAGCAWVLEDNLIPELSQAGEWVAVAGDISLAVSRVGDTQGALLAVSGAGQEIVFPAMEAVAAGALLVGQDPDQAYDSQAIETLIDLGMVTGSTEGLGAHLMEHWGVSPRTTSGAR